MANLKDSNWSKLDIDCLNNLVEFDNVLVNNWIVFALALHALSVVSEMTFKNNFLTIKFANGKEWKIKIVSRSLTTDVMYDLNNTTLWKRDLVSDGIAPLVSATVELYASYGLVELKGLPL